MLEGRVAIVTGGGRGLGRAIAVALAEAGAKVAVASRTREELERTVSLIADRGGTAMSVKTDVSDKGDVANLVRTVAMRYGDADILVNNAGMVGPLGPMKDVGEEKFDRCLAVNFRAMFLTSKAVIPGMVKKGRGKIINVTSGLAEMAVARIGAYAISKAAVNQFTRVLAKELEGYNIQVNGLDPGTVDTAMQEYMRGQDVHTLGPDLYAMVQGLKKGGLLKHPSEAARLAVFIAEDESGITGEVGTEGHFMQWGYRIAA